ncbi:16393_t:CDS:2, partial [Cetraspora pellucida]
MYIVHPSQSELYYLQLLLTKIKGAISFNDLKIVNGSICNSFKQSTYLRGFIKNDDEHKLCMAEAREHQMPIQLYNLFTALLIFENVINENQHGKTVTDYNLPKLLSEIKIKSLLKIILEEINYDITLKELTKVNTLNDAQCAVFEEIIMCIEQKSSGIYFLDSLLGS